MFTSICSTFKTALKLTSVGFGWHATCHVTGKNSKCKCTSLRILLSRVSILGCQPYFKTKILAQYSFKQLGTMKAMSHFTSKIERIFYLQWVWFFVVLLAQHFALLISQEGKVMHQTLLKLIANKSTNRNWTFWIYLHINSGSPCLLLPKPLFYEQWKWTLIFINKNN